ncbi:NitT/TauT family transport system permease protein [Micromonospora viridifaciens]|uniref:NitT/TauT family transport system permease protein n=1 Tax=Micromonospora viridifaciens TaxID=1881 RepID=A0A1C4Y2N6_MICVI|nr:ABC transporter permease [Micromonospora viridifaciens]SCF14987.1 NitT/TauT family transport system permease protein [Micromonospora viridifaciens]
MTVIESRRTRPAKPRTDSRLSQYALPVLGLVAATGLWWAITVVFEVESFLLPSPTQVVQAMVEQSDYLWDNSLVTLWETLLGFLLAIVVGVPLALTVTASRVLERTVYPLLLMLNAVPKVAVAPLLVVWLGFGQFPKVFLVFLVCFFPIVISTAAGLSSTPADLVELGRSLKTNWWQTFRMIRMPAAIPQLFVGLKLAITLAVIGAVIAEFVGATEGLGYAIVASGSSADTALAFAAMILLGVMSVVLFYLLAAIERLCVPWADRA